VTTLARMSGAPGNPLATIQRCPGSERVHVVSPMDDFSVLNRDDRDEPIVVGCATRKNLAAYFVFEDHDAIILAAMRDKCVAGVKLDRLAVSAEACYQIGSTSNRQRPTGEAIAGFEDCVFGKRIEIMIAIDGPLQTLHDDFEKRIDSFKNSVLGFCHKQLPEPFADGPVLYSELCRDPSRKLGAKLGHEI
jgi:hypothetical protein